MVFPGFRASSAEQPPGWSESVPASAGELFGVHESEPGQRDGAFVVAENGLLLLEESGEDTWIPYDDIVGWKELSKEPPALELHLRLRDGRMARLPFHRGGAFAFVQFLIPILRGRRDPGKEG